MTFDFDDDAQRQQLIDDIASFPQNGLYRDKEKLQQRLDQQLALHVMPSDKAEFLEAVLNGASYKNKATAAELAVPHMHQLYPILPDSDEQVQCAYHVAAFSPNVEQQYRALDFMRQTYSQCASNESRIKAVSALLRDKRGTEGNFFKSYIDERYERHKQYFQDWEDCFDKTIDSQKSNEAGKLLNENIYDEFKPGLAKKVYDYLPSVTDPLRQISLIMISNAKWAGLTTESNREPGKRIDPNFWPEDDSLNWPGAMRKACQQAVKDNGYDETLKTIKVKLNAYGYKPWVTQFYADLAESPAYLRDPEIAQDMPAAYQNLRQKMIGNFVLPKPDIRYHKGRDPNPNLN